MGPHRGGSSATILAAFTFPLLVQLVLSYPAGRLQSLPSRAVVAALYVQAGAVAALLALFREPYLDRACWTNCSVNSFLVASRPGVTRAVELADRWLLAIAAVTGFVGNFCWMIIASIFGIARLAENRPIGRVAVTISGPSVS